jgi:hypothetical protein
MREDYTTWHADAGRFAQDDPDAWRRELGDAWRTGFASVDQDDNTDHDAALDEQEAAIYRAVWRIDHVSDPESMAQGELDIAFAQGARTALKAIGAVSHHPRESTGDVFVPAPAEDGERTAVATADRIKELIRRLETESAERTAAQGTHLSMLGRTPMAEGEGYRPADDGNESRRRRVGKTDQEIIASLTKGMASATRPDLSAMATVAADRITRLGGDLPANVSAWSRLLGIIATAATQQVIYTQESAESKLGPIAFAIQTQLDGLHGALLDAKDAGCDLQILIRSRRRPAVPGRENLPRR